MTARSKQNKRNRKVIAKTIEVLSAPQRPLTDDELAEKMADRILSKVGGIKGIKKLMEEDYGETPSGVQFMIDLLKGGRDRKEQA